MVMKQALGCTCIKCVAPAFHHGPRQSSLHFHAYRAFSPSAIMQRWRVQASFPIPPEQAAQTIHSAIQVDIKRTVPTCQNMVLPYYVERDAPGPKLEATGREGALVKRLENLM